jgi:hypothetical protein
MIIEMKSVFDLKLAYFRRFWSWIELGIIGCSWAGLGLYVWRYQKSTRIGNLFRETNGYVYVNLQLILFVFLMCFIFSFVLRIYARVLQGVPLIR